MRKLLVLGVAGALGVALSTPARTASDATPATSDARAATPEALLARTFANLYGFSSIQKVDIRASKQGAHELVRSAQVVRRGARDGLNRMLVRFLGPGELRGIGVLLMERPEFTYDAFLYQPMLGRVRRITVAQRHDRFFGTDVFFEDLEARRADQWTARELRDDHVGSRPVRVLELVPHGLPSAYERIVASFDEELPVILRAEFYRGGQPLKVLDIDPGHIERVGSYYVPTHWTFHGERGSVTIVEISDVELRDSFPDSLFTQATLQYGDPELDARPTNRPPNATP